MIDNASLHLSRLYLSYLDSARRFSKVAKLKSVKYSGKK